MKVLMLLTVLFSASCIAAADVDSSHHEYDFICYRMNTGWIRCVNDEVVCYESPRGLSCLTRDGGE